MVFTSMDDFRKRSYHQSAQPFERRTYLSEQYLADRQYNEPRSSAVRLIYDYISFWLGTKLLLGGKAS